MTCGHLKLRQNVRRGDGRAARHLAARLLNAVRSLGKTGSIGGIGSRFNVVVAVRCLFVVVLRPKDVLALKIRVNG